MDKGLNELLKWSIENTNRSPNGEDAAAPPPPAGERRGLNAEALAALMAGAPSDAELMRAAIEVATDTDPDVALADRLTALDNFEQLVESLDNANNMAPLALWAPLLSVLGHGEPAMRRAAAACVGTAVQNNRPSQERLLAMGGIPRLVGLATHPDEELGVRRKAVFALSSACRNYQPAMDVCTDELAKKGRWRPADGGEGGEGAANHNNNNNNNNKVDAQDMDAVDAVMNVLKDELKAAAAATAATT